MACPSGVACEILVCVRPSMKSSILQASASFASRKYKATKYKEKKLKYNSKLIIYDGEIIRFENTQIVVGSSLFIQDPHKAVFATEDIKNFQFLGIGEIVGLVGSSLIVKSENSYWMYSNKIKNLLYFYMDGDKMCYTYGLNEKSPMLITNCVVYERFLVVTANNHALFLDFVDSNDTQCVFSGSITKFYQFDFNQLQFFIFEYMKYGSQKVALFYSNELLASDVTIKTECLEPAIWYTPKKNRPHNGEVQSRKFSSNSSRLATGSMLTDSGVEFINIEDLKSVTEPDNPTNRDYEQVAPPTLIKNEKKRLFQIMPLEYKALLFAPEKDRLAFLKAVFTAGHFDITSGVVDLLLHSTKKIAPLISENRYLLPDLNCMLNQSFFYEIPDLTLLKNMPRFKFKGRLTERKLLFLNRKYHRIFHYNPQIDKSPNLAYRIIRMEKRYIKNKDSDAIFRNMIDYNKTFMKLMRIYYEDPRIEEILQILLENTVIIRPDIADVNNFRQTAFLLRCSCNIGAFIANPRSIYYSSIYRSPIRINSVIFEDKLPKNIVFLNNTCLFSYFKKQNFQSLHEELGHAFGQGLHNGFSADKLPEYLKLASSSDDFEVGLAYLVLSTYSPKFSITKTYSINTLLQTALENASTNTKMAAMCALAIHNMESHNRNILELLESEAERFGPVNAEKNSAFYNYEYRRIASLCMAMVANRALIINLNDSFCELIVRGLSSIGTSIPESVFDRLNDCRPEEIFYSVLFQLTSNFSMLPELLIENLNNFSYQNDINQIYALGAKLFYISLYYTRMGKQATKSVYRKLYEFALSLEDSLLQDFNIQFLFDFSLISLSIMKSGTCDVALCRTLRRQILKTKEVKFMKEYRLFDFKKKDMTSFKGFSFEAMQIYKMCLGLVCLDFGMSRLKKESVKQLIITFFITGTCLPEFDFIDVLRMLLIRYIEEKTDEIENFKKIAMQMDLKSKRKKWMKLFEKEYPLLSEFDKKFVVDILSDYYENFHFIGNKESIFDIKTLARLLGIAK